MNQLLTFKSLSLAALLTMTASLLMAQNIDDALRYSQLSVGGSARVMGVGGSFGAMGGDFGVTSTNVAGLADYRSKELMFSLSYNQAKTETRQDGALIGENSDGREVILENLAFIAHNKPYYAEKLVTSNFAIGIQQYANFNQVISYETTSRGSIVEPFAADANSPGFDLDLDGGFDVGLADFGSAIYIDESTPNFFTHDLSTPILDNNGNIVSFDNSVRQDVDKEQVIERSGRVNELLMAWAGKFRGGLSIGVGMGIPFVSFQEDKFYKETDQADALPVFNQLNFNESFTTSGVGVNLKLGLGYTIAKKIRLGLGWQSPSYYRMTDNFENSFSYDCTLCETSDEVFQSPAGEFDYGLRTPMRTNLSIGYLLNREKLKGFLNFDVAMVDYASNKFNFALGASDPFLEEEADMENQRIRNELGRAYNYSLGTEVAYAKWRGRAGVSLVGAPFFNDAGIFNNVYAAGMGYRMDRIFFDLAYQYRSNEEGYSPYRNASGDPALQLTSDTQIHKLVLTIGFKL